MQKANARLIATAPDLLAELDQQRAINAELVAALQALLDGRPTEEPPTIAKIAHRNWELFEQARAAIAKATK